MTLFINDINPEGCKSYDQDGVYKPGDLFEFVAENSGDEGWYDAPYCFRMESADILSAEGFEEFLAETSLAWYQLQKERSFIQGDPNLTQKEAKEYLSELMELRRFLERAAKLHSTIEISV